MFIFLNMGWISWLLLLFLYLLSPFLTSSTFSTPSINIYPPPPLLCHPNERSALLQFKNSFFNNVTSSFDYDCDTSITPQTFSWPNGTADCCAWSGVTCDEMTGHVVGLDLPCGRLQGIFHSNSSLFFLHHLQNLDLSFNDFRGSTIPSELGKFTNLVHLNFQYSNFSGHLPLEISYLSKLVSLDLSYNNHELRVDTFTFERIVANLTKLEEFYMDEVDMSAVEPISWMNLSSSLRYLTLKDCRLQGNLQDYISHLQKLELLYLDSNENLTGFLPKSNWSSPLKFLSLSRTKFLIDLPSQIQNFMSLEYLALSRSKILGWNPILLANLTKITWLDLSSNNLGGQIPWSSLFHIKGLEYLDLSGNDFMGQLPEIYSYNSTHVSFLSNYSSYNLTATSLPLELEFLYLNDNLLNGTIPRWLFSLPFLQYLFLQNNQFTGYIHEFESLSLEQLILSTNKFSGSIPRSIFQQVKLDLLDLSSNDLSGDAGLYEFSNLTSLAFFSISNNRLNGEIPSSICKLDSLEVLDLSNNSLNGKIHPCIGDFSYSLSVMNLHMNNLHGTIPLTFAKGNSLRDLNLNGNQLEGSLPESLFNCKKLEVLDVGSNKIIDTFPHWLESLPMLQVLVLKSNRFHGSIDSPKAAFHFQKLRIMDLSDNVFSGNLPSKYFDHLVAMMDADTNQLKYMGRNYYKDSVTVAMKGITVKMVKIQTIFTTIDLSNNKFHGEIPELIGKLKALKGLNFSHNKLTGSIPSTLGNLSNLEWLDLSSNELVGEIPRQLTNMIFLEVLNLSKNRLVGPIPRGKQFDTFGNYSYGENLGLCGFPLSELCSNNETQQSSPTNFQQEGDSKQINCIDWKIVWIGYGCGMAFGIWLGYIMLSNRNVTLFMIRLGGEQWSKILTD